MKQKLQKIRDQRRRRERRLRWRQYKQGAWTVTWVMFVLFGLILPKGWQDPILNPALLGVVARVLPARRRNVRRQPNHAAAAYGRYSSHLQDDVTLDSQFEECDTRARADSNQIDPRFKFFDEAVSGTKLRRVGLDRLLAEAKAGLFDVLYFYSLSRLARESVIGMPILKRLVYVYKIRVVSVTEGVDSALRGWEDLASMLFLQHERYIKDLSENSFRGQKTNVGNNYSNGDYCFGFTGEPVPGTENTRRGRHRTPRMRYKIDPVAAEWVRRIFEWYVREKRPLRWITRELNRLKVPKDHRSTTPDWHHQSLARLIANIKLIGIWPWGLLKNSRDPETGDVTQEERPAEESAKWLRRMPELQLVDDQTFLDAQDRLKKNAEDNARRHDEQGRFNKDQEDIGWTNPLHLLASLIVCAVCGRKFYVGELHGNYLFCPGYINGTCSCRTMLRRELAERLILEQISQRMLDGSSWLQRTITCTIGAWTRLQTTLPNELQATQAALAEVNLAIRRYLDFIERHDTVEPDIQNRIAERRAERHELEARLEQLRQSARCVPAEPTAEWIAEQLRDLLEVLKSGTPAAAFALRDLVGGSIVVEEAQLEGRNRRHLRGTFRLQIGAVLPVTNGIDSAAATGVQGELVTIDFLAPNPLDAKAEQVKALWDQGMLGKDIAAALKCSRAQVTKLLKHWADKHGVELPNGHARRMELKYQANPPLYRQIARQSHELLERGLLISEIATELGCDINTVRKAARHWCQLHGLPWVDGRVRRKDLDHKSRPRAGDDREDDQDYDGQVAAATD